MQMTSALKLGATVLGIGVGAAVLGACAKRNEGKTSEGVAGDVTNRYDQNGDSKLNTQFEGRRTETDSECTLYADYDGDGISSCVITNTFTNNYSIAALLDRADNHHGNRDGVATQSELAKVVREFDLGSQDGKAIAGNNILERPEIDSFNRNYEEQYTGRTG
jgi:hypothetical protein